MNNKKLHLDVLVPKEIDVTHNGITERRTRWNRIGRAWFSKSGMALNMELFMYPNQLFVIKSQTKKEENVTTEVGTHE